MKFKEKYKRTAGFVTFYFVWLKKTGISYFKVYFVTLTPCNNMYMDTIELIQIPLNRKLVAGHEESFCA